VPFDWLQGGLYPWMGPANAQSPPGQLAAAGSRVCTGWSIIVMHVSIGCYQRKSLSTAIPKQQQ
jgi:hypothetical protein